MLLADFGAFNVGLRDTVVFQSCLIAFHHTFSIPALPYNVMMTSFYNLYLGSCERWNGDSFEKRTFCQRRCHQKDVDQYQR